MKQAHDEGPFYHGTKAELKAGDCLGPGHMSNYPGHKESKYIYFSATLDAAVWGAELAAGEGPGRIYIVEPTGAFEDDPNLTDKKFPGNPTRSYRAMEPLRIADELQGWEGHPAEQLASMRAGIERLRESGLDKIIE